MRLASCEGRAVLVVGDGIVDLERRSDGRFDASPMAALYAWDELREFAAGLGPGDAEAPLEPEKLGPCVPVPAQVFGIGLNYRDHAEEAGLDIPKQPMVFTKFPSCLAGPTADVPLTSNRCDYEVELVVAIGRGGQGIAPEQAFDHVAGYCVGNDVSDRRAQFADKPPQFSMGKSATAFGPIGPALVTLDEVDDPDDLPLTCDVSGERLQDGRTRDMIFPVAELVSFLSRNLTLAPGDLIFTGTPAGVGSVRKRYLEPGDWIASEIPGLGRLRNKCVEGPSRG